MKKKFFIYLPVLAVALAVVSFSAVFTVPSEPQLITIGQSGSAINLQCYNNPSPRILDVNGRLNVLVWNIYKQNRPNWKEALEQYSSQVQLVLLQEASMTPDMQEWIEQRGWGGTQVNAFRVFGERAGVLNLSVYMPRLVCAYTELEPWLRLPKSGLYALYRLSQGKTLAVVNLHAINFTYGTNEYSQQLQSLKAALSKHEGPLIVAGDFNSWSEERIQAMKQSLSELGVREAQFEPDKRRRFVNGLPLDHLFYRGLTLLTAEAPETDASDHSPLLVSFSW